MIRILSLSDEKAIQLIQQGGRSEEHAIKHLLEAHGAVVKNFVVNHGGSMDAGEEILYEAITSLVFNIRSGKFAGQSKLGTYLFGIAKRKWYKTANKEVSLHERHEGWGEWMAHHEAYEDQTLNHGDQKQVLSQLFDLLGKGCKEVLLLWGQHYSMEEIAQKMGLKNAQIAMNKKSKCFRQLLQKIEQAPGLKQALAELHFG